ncbi:hypothetical protein Q9189_007530, partial [Teloschistes chrysophthalmus]
MDAKDRQKVFERSHTIINLTKSIRSTPSNSSLWLQRAEELHQMGYTDLAVGDVWKAAMLNDLKIETTHRVRAQLGAKGTKSRLETILDSQREVYVSLACFLLLLEDYAELIEICDDGLAKYGVILQEVFSTFRTKAEEQLGSRSPGLNVNTKAETLYKTYHGAGEFEKSLESAFSRFLAYPFMPPEYLRRQPKDVAQSKLLFHTGTTTCHLLSSSVRKWDESHDVFGIFATRNIEAGETLFEDRTILGSCSVSASAPSTLPEEYVNGIRARLCENCYGITYREITACCCETYYCSIHCRDIALACYHKVLCGKDFTWLFDDCKKLPKSVAGNGPLWLRILAICVQSGLHPLDHPIIARLTPNYVPVGRKWSFTNMTKQPFEILGALGINACKDERYDSWVLHTIWARVLNNRCLEHTCNLGSNPNESKHYDLNVVSPMYSFFNHSCEPNAMSQGVTRYPTTEDFEGCYGGTTKVMKATRGIRRGEEVFVSYAEFEGGETRED